MTNRYRVGLPCIAAIVTALAVFAAQPVFGRIPWAATNGQHFVEAVVNADNYRMRAAALAMRRSPSSDVRELARDLWEDALEDTRRLRWMVTGQDALFVLWTQVTPEYRFVLDELVAAGGETFDQRFIAQQTVSLNDSLALAEGYAQTGDDLDLKEFAARSVPKIKIQLDRIVMIRSQHQTLASR